GIAVLGLALDTADLPIPASLNRLESEAAAKRADLDELASLRLPADERDGDSPGLAWPDQDRRQRDAVLQPPHHEIDPSADVLSAYRDTRSIPRPAWFSNRLLRSARRSPPHPELARRHQRRHPAR